VTGTGTFIVFYCIVLFCGIVSLSVYVSNTAAAWYVLRPVLDDGKRQD